MSSSSPHTLGSQSIMRLLIKYSVPAIISMTITSLYNVIDSIYIGNGVGALGIAGMAVTLPIMNLVIAFCTVIAVGGSSMVSIYLGEHNLHKATKVLHNVLILLIISGVFIAVTMSLLLDPILAKFGTSAETHNHAKSFMQIILLGTPISYTFIGLNNMVRATGHPRKAMMSAVVSVFCNVLIAPIFIFKLNMGMAGAALATILSQGVGLLSVLNHLLSKKTYVRFKSGYNRLSWVISKKVLTVGLSPFIMNICTCAVVVFINISLARYGGDVAIGAYGIINRLLLFITLTVIGFTMGMQPIIGYNYGAKRYDRVRKTILYGLVVGYAISTFGFVLFRLFPNEIIRLFSDNIELNKIAVNGLLISTLAFPFVGGQIVISSLFQSIGRPLTSIALSLSRQVIFFIPLLFTLPAYWGIDGVWYCHPISDFASITLGMVALLVLLRRLKQNRI